MKKSLLVLAIVLLAAFGAVAQPVITGSYSYSLEFTFDDDDTNDMAAEDADAQGSFSITSEDGAASFSVDIDAEELSYDVAHASVSFDPLALAGVEAPVTVGMTLSTDDEALDVTVPDVVAIGLAFDIASMLNGTDGAYMGVTADVLAVPGLTLGLSYDMNTTFSAGDSDYEITTTIKDVNGAVRSEETNTVAGTALSVTEQGLVNATVADGSVAYSVEKVDGTDGDVVGNGLGVDLGVDLVALAGLPLDAASVSFGLTMDKMGIDGTESETSWDTGVDVGMAGATVGLTFNSDSELGVTASYAGVPNLTNSVSLDMAFTADDPDTTTVDESDVSTSLGVTLGYALSDALNVSVGLGDLLDADYKDVTVGLSYAAGLTYAVDLALLGKSTTDTTYTYDGVSAITSGGGVDSVADPTLTFTVSGSF